MRNLNDREIDSVTGSVYNRYKPTSISDLISDVGFATFGIGLPLYLCQKFNNNLEMPRNPFLCVAVGMLAWGGTTMFAQKYLDSTPTDISTIV